MLFSDLSFQIPGSGISIQYREDKIGRETRVAWRAGLLRAGLAAETLDGELVVLCCKWPFSVDVGRFQAKFVASLCFKYQKGCLSFVVCVKSGLYRSKSGCLSIFVVLASVHFYVRCAPGRPGIT